jgi:alcohol dehydrogenase YqhD (iron-dependent ADH family)
MLSHMFRPRHSILKPQNIKYTVSKQQNISSLLYFLLHNIERNIITKVT